MMKIRERSYLINNNQIKQNKVSFGKISQNSLNSDVFVSTRSTINNDKNTFKGLISFTSKVINNISFFGATKEPDPLQKCTIQSIVNIFETGKPLGNYSQVTLIKGDPGHLTYGRSQTTLASGNLYFLIKSYCEKTGSQFGKDFQPYLDRLASKDLTLDNDAILKDLLKKAGNDPVMHQAQDEFFERAYYKPALNRANQLGICTPLGVAVVYDSYIHGAFNTVYKLTNTNLAKTPEEAGEKKWIEAYVNTRRNWLANHSKTVLHNTVYRMDAFKDIIKNDNWNLALPMKVRSYTITEDTFKDSVPDTKPVPEDNGKPSADTKNWPLLMLVKNGPYMQNEYVEDVQIALKNRGYNVDLDGIYNPKTEAAVIKFQTDKNLKADGIVGKITYEALRVGAENKYYPVIKLTNPYQKGEHIKDVQEALKNKGYNVTVDGVYGEGSKSAVKEFQKKNNLLSDGVVGMKTYMALGIIEA